MMEMIELAARENLMSKAALRSIPVDVSIPTSNRGRVVVSVAPAGRGRAMVTRIG